MRRNQQIVILADDLTGALDVAAPFAQHGLRTFVSTHLKSVSLPNVDVVSINADTRRMTTGEASSRVSDHVRALAASRRHVTYVKIDSTLRGHPGTEIGVAAELSNSGLVLVAPSFPRTGRVVENGQLLVHGIPLAETEVGKDPLSPAGTSNVAEILSRGTTLPVNQLSIDEVRSPQLADRLRLLSQETPDQPAILACDSTTDEDLALIATACTELNGDPAVRNILLVGSAGLASALASQTQDKSNNNAKTSIPMQEPLLVVTASQRSLADEQIVALESAGLARTALLKIDVNVAGAVSSVEVTDAEKIEANLTAQQNVALRATVNGDLTRLSPEQMRLAADEVTRTLGEQVADLASRHRLGGLVIIGGDTAHALLSAVEAHGILLAAEPLPGVALGTIAGGALDGVPVATKAGAFGDRQTLVQLFQKLLPGQEPI